MFRMQATLCVCALLATLAAGQHIDSGYVPPQPNPGGVVVAKRCPPVSTVTQYVNSVVVRTERRDLTQQVVRHVQRTIVSELLVPSHILSTSLVLRTTVVTSQVVRTVQKTNFVTSTLLVGGTTSRVVFTLVREVVKTVVLPVVQTLTSTHVRTTNVIHSQLVTVVSTHVLQVPQVVVSTLFSTVPGPQVVVTDVRPVVRTAFVTQPARQVFRTTVVQDVRVVTNYVTVPGAVRTSTAVLPTTQVVPVRSQVVVSHVITARVTETEKYERTLFMTFTSARVVPVVVPRTVLVTSHVRSTALVRVTTTQYRDVVRTVTERVPVAPIRTTQFNTLVVTVSRPGSVVQVVRTVVGQPRQRQVVHTEIVRQPVRKVVVVDVPCRSGSGDGGIVVGGCINGVGPGCGRGGGGCINGVGPGCGRGGGGCINGVGPGCAIGGNGCINGVGPGCGRGGGGCINGVGPGCGRGGGGCINGVGPGCSAYSGYHNGGYAY